MYSIPRGQEEGEVYVRELDVEKERGQLEKNIQQDVKCRLKGTLPLPKVTVLVDIDAGYFGVQAHCAQQYHPQSRRLAHQ